MSPTYTFTNSKGQLYYLHGKDVTLKNGHKVRIYYFARDERPTESLGFIPEGYKVIETERTGMPVLKKTN